MLVDALALATCRSLPPPARRDSPAFPLRMAMAILVICQVTACEPSRKEHSRPAGSDSTDASTGSGADANSPDAAASHDWDAIYIRDQHIGYSKTTRSLLTEDGQQLRRTVVETQLDLRRFGQQSQSRMVQECVESPEGQLVRFRSEVGSPNGVVVTGAVDGDELAIVTQSNGARRSRKLPWKPSFLGFFGIEQLLRASPPAPKASRIERMLVPGLGGVELADHRIESFGREATTLLDGSRDLRKYQVTITVDKNTIEASFWTDDEGNIVKQTVPSLGQTSYRTTEEMATKSTEGSELDLGFDLVVPVKNPLAKPHETRRVLFEVKSKSANPANAFASDGLGQQVTSIDQHTARITVQAVRPDWPAGPLVAHSEPPTGADLASNSLLQTDDEQVQALARSVAGDETEAWAIAVVLEKRVREHVQVTSYKHALATAADVVRTREGDCTELAVLLAATCRVRGIPARVASGLIYYEPRNGFAFHMWTEIWAGDRWVGLDATRARGGTSAAYLKLRHSNLEDGETLGVVLAVLPVLRDLEIQVLAM